MSLKVIDFDRKGNVIRFYLGKKTAAWGWTNPDYKDPYDGKRPDLEEVVEEELAEGKENGKEGE